MPSKLKSVLITTSINHHLVVISRVRTTVKRMPTKTTTDLFDTAVSSEAPLGVGGTAVVV